MSGQPAQLLRTVMTALDIFIIRVAVGARRDDSESPADPEECACAVVRLRLI
jgi:hypothetical protein